MSADNRICIMQTFTGRWAVWHGSGSCDYYEEPAGAERFDTEAEAFDHARAERTRIGYLEYGIQVISREEQGKSLVAAIADLQERLALLDATGSQFRLQD